MLSIIITTSSTFRKIKINKKPENKLQNSFVIYSNNELTSVNMIGNPQVSNNYKKLTTFVMEVFCDLKLASNSFHNTALTSIILMN